MALLLDTYRKNAAAAELEAQRGTLPYVRLRAADAAARWSEMADRLEWVEEQRGIRLDTAEQARTAAR